MDLAELGLAEAAGLIRRGDVSSVDYTLGLLERANEHTDLHVFITLRPEPLLDAAHRADQAWVTGRGHAGPLGPLHGVPIAVKDNIDTADLPTTGGTPALLDHRPAADAAVVRRLREAGALVLGKTNMHELAYGVTSDNTAFGPVANPYHPGRIAGGSSGGSAAAVSAGIAAAALGTDTGGSVRMPASLCGVAGLRPTMGRYPQQGVILLSGTRDTVGPLARTVPDLILLDSVITGGTRPAEPGGPEEPDGLEGLRLGVIRRPFWAGLAADLAGVLERRLAQLAEHGVTVLELDLPAHSGELIVKAGFPIAFYETTVELRRYLAQGPVSLEEVVERCGSEDVREILTGLIGDRAVPRADYDAAVAHYRPALTGIFGDLFAAHRLDAVAWPATPLTAAPLGTREVSLGGEPISAFLAYTRTTNPGSIIGWPGVSVPAGLDGAGLPAGLALDGPAGSDLRLLRIARHCERIFGPLPRPVRRGDGHADSVR